MGDPVSAAIMAVGSAGMKYAGNLSEGIAKKTAAQIDAIKLKMQAEAGKVRAVQVDAAYRDDLNQTLQTINAFRSAQNVSIDSPTGMALADEAERRSDRARIAAASNEKIKALGLEGDSTALLKGADQYTKAALLKSIPDFISAGQSIGKLLPTS